MLRQRDWNLRGNWSRARIWVRIGPLVDTAQYQAWLVDLDGTLYRPLPVKLAMGASLLLKGRRALPAIKAFRAAHEQVRGQKLAPGLSPYQAQLEQAAKASGWELERLSQTVEEWMIQRPGPWLKRACRGALVAQIEAYVGQGGTCALVSDYPASKKLAAMGLESLFSAVVSSGEPGGPSQLKPDPEGYLLAAKALGVEPQACLVIGDRQDADGEAARRAGMGFLLVK